MQSLQAKPGRRRAARGKVPDLPATVPRFARRVSQRGEEPDQGVGLCPAPIEAPGISRCLPCPRLTPHLFRRMLSRGRSSAETLSLFRFVLLIRPVSTRERIAFVRRRRFRAAPSVLRSASTSCVQRHRFCSVDPSLTYSATGVAQRIRLFRVAPSVLCSGSITLSSSRRGLIVLAARIHLFRLIAPSPLDAAPTGGRPDACRPGVCQRRNESVLRP